MTDTVNSTTGLAEAATAFSGLLSDDLVIDQGSRETPIADKSEKPEAEAQGDEGANASHETTDEDSHADGSEEGSDEGEEEQEPTAEEQEDEEPSAPAQTFTVKIDGKEVKVSRDEVINGYQRHADYSRKTAALAEERRAFDAIRAEHQGERQAVQTERGQYATLLKALHARLEELAPQEPNWQELFARDKNEYLIARDNWRAIQEQKDAAASELQRVDEANRAEALHNHQVRLQASHAKLLEWEPRWKDSNVRNSDFKALAEYALNTLGYSAQELASADDPRALMAVYKAMQYDALKAKAATVKPTGSKSPTAKPGGAARQVSPQTRSAGNAKQRLAKSGRVADAAAVFSQMDL